VPVINGLSDCIIRARGLTDVFTIVEELGGAAGKTLTYVGDGNNVAHSLMQAAAKAGMHVRICTPASFEPDPEILASAQREARIHGGSVTLLTEPKEQQQARTFCIQMCGQVWVRKMSVSADEKYSAVFR